MESKCTIYEWSSRVCQHGTKSCVVDHAIEVKAEKCEPVAWHITMLWRDQKHEWTTHHKEDVQQYLDRSGQYTVTPLFATPQPCPRCSEYQFTADDMQEQFEQGVKCGETHSDPYSTELQAKVAELEGDLTFTANRLLARVNEVAALSDKYECNTAIMHARTAKMNEYAEQIASLTQERDEWKDSALNGGNAGYLRQELNRANAVIEKCVFICDDLVNDYSHNYHKNESAIKAIGILKSRIRASVEGNFTSANVVIDDARKTLEITHSMIQEYAALVGGMEHEIGVIRKSIAAIAEYQGEK